MTASEYAKNSGFGLGSDRTKFDDNGRRHTEGDSAVWNDISTSVIGSRLYSTAGKVDYNFDNNSITMASGGSISTVMDRLVGNIQMSHSLKVDTSLRLHIHWEQPDATEREFTVQYRIQKVDAVKETTWTTVISNSVDDCVYDYVSGTLNQITKMATIDLTGVGLSAVVQFRLARTDSEVGDIEITFIDGHYQSDRDGTPVQYIS